MADAHPGPLDPRVVEDLRGLSAGDPVNDLVRELYGGWLGEIPGRLAAIEEALGTADLASVERHAHGLHGTAASLGLPEVDRRALDLETHAHRGDTAEARAALERLAAAVDRARGALSVLPELRSAASESGPPG
ncbi:MAG: Hpt domain-containing protein [Myxococcota bacterium]